MPDVENHPEELSYRMDNITWVGVDLKGTTFHFQVVEKNAPEPGEVTGAQHLVASKKAVIVRMFVEEGDPKVAVTDYVEKGQLLVSGLIGTEDKPKGVPAKGEVFGKLGIRRVLIFPSIQHFPSLQETRRDVSTWDIRVEASCMGIRGSGI